MEQLRVSVVVPVYNVEPYLNRCVESIVNQTYKNLEIILVDDGSPDHCPAMCDEWAQKDDRIRVVHKQNAGLGMARNTGMDNATGRYILFIDSDDYIHPTLVEKCVNSATQNRSQVVMYGLCNDVDGTVTPKPITAGQLVFQKEQVQNDLLAGLFTYRFGFGISCCMKMFDLPFLKEKGLRFQSERAIISEDAFFILELFSGVECASIVPENLYYYYRNTNSLTTRFREDRQAQNDLFMQKAKELIEHKNLSKTLLDCVTARYHMYTVSALKQLFASDLPKKKKKAETKKIYKSKVLINSLEFGVIGQHKKSLQLFFGLLKFRGYALCTLFLKLKQNK